MKTIRAINPRLEGKKTKKMQQREQGWPKFMALE
jgi:hypothetical protein